MFDDRNSTVECTFLDTLDTEQIETFSCSIELNICQPTEKKPVNKVFSGNVTDRRNNILKIELTLETMSEKCEYCYTITASNNISTVKINGTFSRGNINF